MCESNQEPRFFCRVYGTTSTSPTLILLTDTLDRYLLVPITRNSVSSSFNLSLIIRERTSAMHFSIASSASASHVLSNGRNDKYNWVSSVYECAGGRWDLIILKSLLAELCVLIFYFHEKSHPLTSWACEKNPAGWHMKAMKPIKNFAQ